MADAILNFNADLDDPAWTAVAVTPNDSADLARTATRALYIGGSGSGNLSVVMSGGGTIAFAGLTAPFILPIRVDRVNNTGTDVTGIVALY